ncbi:sugar ABC transporter ATP-binding protein [Pendulispora albinea]|uniref:Sugar ABC transporter ATP-binding protein n=1 Tax=Pendulispora albinea TaxID=2741071 RepID=A0ABZ2LZ07_9BACT
MAEPMVVAAGIHKRFGGITALRGVTLEIQPGEVHCLAGENGCGKSTLIKIIGGVERPDEGAVSVLGRAYSALDPRLALDLGIQTIHQDFSLLPNLTVAENIALSALVAARRRRVRKAEIAHMASAAIERLGVALDLEADVADLSVADRQLTAIGRALAQDARVIFMDEPTTALTWREVDALFRTVRTLKERGVATVFVSHKLDEALGISDRVTVLRSGEVTATGDAKNFDRATLTYAMTGRELVLDRPPSYASPEASEAGGATRLAPALQVENLGRRGMFAGVSFTVHPGEIVGITGLLGSGRTEIAEAIFGLMPADEGTIRVGGELRRIQSVQDAIASGIGYVPEDRLTQGLFLDQSIETNIIAADVDRHAGPLGLLRRGALAEAARDAISALRIKAPVPGAPVRSLSGGNAQRVVLAKWLERRPNVLILNGPTVGVDVGSKFDILAILRNHGREGMGIVIISDDVPELISICHRALIVRRGRIDSELAGDDLTEAALLARMAA